LELGGVFGYSGPGIKPLVLAAIWSLRQAGIGAEILGIGGVAGADDVREYLSVGATVVQVYTALHTDMYATLDAIVSGVVDREPANGELTARSATESGVEA
jgi:dihydroorotate dehydrogenase